MKQTIVIASSLMNPNEKLPLILVDKGKTGRYQKIYIYMEIITKEKKIVERKKKHLKIIIIAN